MAQNCTSPSLHINSLLSLRLLSAWIWSSALIFQNNDNLCSKNNLLQCRIQSLSMKQKARHKQYFSCGKFFQGSGYETKNPKPTKIKQTNKQKQINFCVKYYTAVFGRIHAVSFEDEIRHSFSILNIQGINGCFTIAFGFPYERQTEISHMLKQRSQHPACQS